MAGGSASGVIIIMNLFTTAGTSVDQLLCGGIRAIEQSRVFISILFLIRFLSITTTQWFLLGRIIGRVFTNTGHEYDVAILRGFLYILT